MGSSVDLTDFVHLGKKVRPFLISLGLGLVCRRLRKCRLSVSARGTRAPGQSSRWAQIRKSDDETGLIGRKEMLCLNRSSF